MGCLVGTCCKPYLGNGVCGWTGELRMRASNGHGFDVSTSLLASLSAMNALAARVMEEHYSLVSRASSKVLQHDVLTALGGFLEDTWLVCSSWKWLLHRLFHFMFEDPFQLQRET